MRALITLLALTALLNTANARTVMGLATMDDLESVGIISTKTAIPGGTVIVDNEAGTFALAYDDQWGYAATYSPNGYREIKVGDSEPFWLGYGAVGNTNPTFVSYKDGVMSSGSVFEIKAKEDGWMTLFTRMNPNKQYIVFEGKTEAIPYTLGVADSDHMINYTLPAISRGERSGYMDFDAEDASKYFIDGERPQFPYVVSELETAPGMGAGFVTFHVRAGKTYYFSALGSKASCGGFVFTDTKEAPSVTFCATINLPELNFKTDLKYPERGTPVINPVVSGSNNILFASPETLQFFGLTDGKIPLEGGTTIFDSEDGSFGIAYDDDWGPALTYRNYQHVKVGDSGVISLGTGIAGNTNPSFISYQDGVMSSGAVFEIKVKENGWLTLFTRLNPNKKYIVFEGDTKVVPYTLGYANPDYIINYTLPFGPDGYVDFDSEDASIYFQQLTEQGDGLIGPKCPYEVADLSTPPSDSTGFLTFRVSAGKTYYFSAIGSKTSCQGFVLTKTEKCPAVTFYAQNGLPEVNFKEGLSAPNVADPSIEEPVVSGNNSIVMASIGNLSSAGLKNTKTEHPGGTVIMDTTVGSFELAYDDQWGITYYNSTCYKNVKVGDSEVITLYAGAVGNTNPVFVSYQDGVMSAGAVFKINVRKDGWLTIFTKLNPDKEYLVFEGEKGAVPYTLGVAGPDYMINYTLPSDQTGHINFDAKDASKYFTLATKQATSEGGIKLWELTDGSIVAADTRPDGSVPVIDEIPGQYKPKKPYLVADLASTPSQNTGFLTFKAEAGKTYHFSGLGTKPMCSGFVLTESETPPEVTFCATEEYKERKFQTGLIAPVVIPPIFAGSNAVISGNSTILLASTDDLEAAGLSTEKTECQGGTVIMDSEVGSFALAYDDLWVGTVTYAGYRSVRVGDSNVFGLGFGVAGNENPSFSSYQDGVMSTGSVFEIKAKRNGWMTVFTKMNPGKQYVVMEGTTGAVAYTLGVASTDNKVINYTLPEFKSGGEVGYIDFTETEATKYFINTENGGFVPQFPYRVAGLNDAPATGTGFLTFWVWAGNTYYISGLGTKMVCQGFILTEDDEQPEVIFSATENLPEVKFSTGLINPTLAVDYFESEGMRFIVLDSEARTCKVKDRGNKLTGDVILPEIIIGGEKEYKLTEIGSEAFAGSNRMESISLPSTIKNAGSDIFLGCDRLSSLIWRGDNVMPSGILESVENPNLLIYVDSTQFVSTGIERNIVAGGRCQNLTIVPGHAFRAAETFVADYCSFTKEFKQSSSLDGCSGWETLVLPFDVWSVSTSDGRTLSPFSFEGATSSKRHYWLYEADENGIWRESSAIKAGVPYIISMPNNPQYIPSFNVQGEVTFFNPNPQEIGSSTSIPKITTWASGHEFRSLWMPLDDTQATDAMGLNVNITNITDDNGQTLLPGSAFCKGIRPRPLEAYVSHKGTNPVFLIKDNLSRVQTITETDGLKIEVQGRTVLLECSEERTVEIYSADGTLLRRVALTGADIVSLDDLPQGVCIIGGRKVMIK